jgi:ketosteroid isomerase-like protein
VAQHPSATVVRAFDALSRGGVETSTRLLSPDVVWRLPRGGTVVGEQRDLVGLDGVIASTIADLTTTDGLSRLMSVSSMPATSTQSP